MTEGARTVPAHDTGELGRARAHIAALEELLSVHEQTSLEAANRLEEALAAERRIRDRLAESEERTRLALDAGGMGSWEWDIAENRVHWSPEEERLYGLEPGSYSGTVEEYRERIHPEDRDAAFRAAMDALARRDPSHHVVHRVVWPDGTVRWIDSHARFIYADDGRPLRLVGVSADVTEQRELQRALEHERSRLQAILMQAPASITVSEGPDHIVVMQNEVATQLVGGRSLIGKRVKDLFPEIEAQGLVALQDGVYRTGEPYVGRETLVRFDRNADGELEDAYFNFVYQPLTDPDGKVYGVLTHAVEVTDQVVARREIEEKAEQLTRLTKELERSNGELDQFAYVASHDLKAPLRGIANLTQWIEEDLGDKVTGETREHMQLLKGRVHRMEGLIEGILAYSRAGRVRERPEPLDVRHLVAETVELLAPGDQVEILIAPDLPTIEAERVPLQQVFMNLIGNAIKYNDRPDPRVRISATEVHEHWCQFSVADNGPGIPQQYQDRIWQIFQTLAPRDKVEGTGIGLSVVRKLVEARGGRAWLESEVGRGTTFHFTWRKHPRESQ